VTKDEGKKLVTDMLEKGKTQKVKMEDFVAEIVQRVLDKADVARRTQVEELEHRIDQLEERLNKQE
jgi:polyhydroxyalkanoate synthesis regulator phasin